MAVRWITRNLLGCCVRISFVKLSVAGLLNPNLFPGCARSPDPLVMRRRTGLAASSNSTLLSANAAKSRPLSSFAFPVPLHESVLESTLAQLCAQRGAGRVPASKDPSNNNKLPESCWETLDRVNLKDVCESRFVVLQSCSHSVRGRFRQVVRRAFEDVVGEIRGGSSSVCCHCGSFVELQTVTQFPGRTCSKDVIFLSKAWGDVMREARSSLNERQIRSHSDRNSEKKRWAEAACPKIQLGEVSRARQCLTSASLAPRSDATRAEMQSRQLQEHSG